MFPEVVTPQQQCLVPATDGELRKAHWEPYAPSTSAQVIYYIRARKCNSDPEKSLVDIERIRTHMGRQGLPIDVVGCWPQAVHNQRTGKLKRFDWGAMILQIRAYGMEPSEAAEALNALKLECSFQLEACVEFEVWRQPVDPQHLNNELSEHGVEPPALKSWRCAKVVLDGFVDDECKRFVVLRRHRPGDATTCAA